MLMTGFLRFRRNSLHLLGLTAISGAVFAFGCDAGESSDDEGAGGAPSSPTPQAGRPAVAGSPGSPGAAGSPGVAGSGSTGAAGAPAIMLPEGGTFGMPNQMVQGMSSERYAKAAVQRDGVNYLFMANGWGPNFMSQTVAWRGTSFVVASMQGQRGAMYEPASYPTMFCGVYSDSMSGACGLPAPIASINSLKTGWSWSANGNTGQYNAAYDIWISSNDTAQGLTEYLMVWYRDPPGQQPAGSVKMRGITVPGVEGTWDFWAGRVNNKDYYAYVKPEGQDIPSLEFDVMDFVKDLPARSIALKGTTIISVAIGFEIWQGPVTNLATNDFYVKVE